MIIHRSFPPIAAIVAQHQVVESSTAAGETLVLLSPFVNAMRSLVAEMGAFEQARDVRVCAEALARHASFLASDSSPLAVLPASPALKQLFLALKGMHGEALRVAEQAGA